MSDTAHPATADETAADAAPPRKPFTGVTWVSVGNRVGNDSNLGWPAQADLGHQLHQLAPHLTAKQCRDLVDYANSGLPVVLTWDTPMDGGKTERHTTTVIVQWITPPHPVHASIPGRVRIRYSGFGHEVRIGQIREVSVPPSTISYH